MLVRLTFMAFRTFIAFMAFMAFMATFMPPVFIATFMAAFMPLTAFMPTAMAGEQAEQSTLCNSIPNDLSQAFKTFNQFGQISSVLGLNSHTHDRGDGELHDLQVVSLLSGGNGTSLDQKLINTDKTTDVTTRYIFDSLNVTSHHEDGPLDGLLVQVLLLAGGEVGAHDTDLLTGSNLAGEDTAESVEAAFVGGGHHLGDVHHQGAIGVARLHGHSSRIVIRAFVQHVGSVLLGGGGGRQMDNDHLEHSLTSWQPVPHDSLHQRLAFKLQFFIFHLSLQFQFVQKFIGVLLLEVHDSIEHFVDGIQNELTERSDVVLGLSLAPLLGLGVEEVGTPQFLHQFIDINAEFSCVQFRELLEGKGPSVKAGTEAHRGVGRI